MERIFPAALLLIITATATALTQLRANYDSAARGACALVDEHYYRRDLPEVRKFVAWCRQMADQQSFILSRAANIQRINGRLSAMRISHLSVYNPDENRMMWDNEGLDTGIRSRMIDGELVVFRLLPGSPGELAGLRPGDSLLTLNGEELRSSFSAQSGSGRLVFRRNGGAEIAVDIRPEELAEEMAPTLRSLAGGAGLLRLPSFLGQYFAGTEWSALVGELSRYKGIVIDLRDNAGGSFPAMLRALSPFICDRQAIGRIYHSPGPGFTPEVDLRDDLDSASQLGQLAQAESIVLRTFDGYGCYRGPVRALIDGGTSSVAEIFAQALVDRPRTRLLGQTSAGQVVMAQWFPLPAFGSDSFVMSVPIAGYQTRNGGDLEENGVQPQRFLFYDLPSALRGRDSWIEVAQRSLGKISN